QTAGPDIRNPSSYRPTNFVFNDNTPIHEIRELRGNARHPLPFAQSIFAKAGFRWREEVAASTNRNRRYTFTGLNSGQLPTDPTIETFGDHKAGLAVPRWNANALARGRTPVDPALWTEDRYFAEQSKYTGTRRVTETVKAAYGMLQGRIHQTGFIAGVRAEQTDDDGWGWVKRPSTPAKPTSTTAQQLADPVGAAANDYASSRREISGSYTKSFPSVHLTQDLTSNLKARLSWSNGFGRPPLSNSFPSETPNDTAQTLTISNPALKPRLAENWDAALEYYFEPVGSFTLGWFHKTIRDYTVSGILSGTVGTGTDNGYNGEYAGYTILTSQNLGTAYAQGWEISYAQQFTFLPGWLKGLGGGANFTLLDTHGDFGSTTNRAKGEVPGFIPFTGNANLSWRHRGLSARVIWNRTGEYINAFTASGSGRNQYTRRRTIVNASVAYQVRPTLTFSVDVGNVFNTPQIFYRGIADQISEYRIPGITVTFGVSGRF
ncbi:MAG: TonB-dependent receptor, partial [Opitutaceae bacterium]